MIEKYLEKIIALSFQFWLFQIVIYIYIYIYIYIFFFFILTPNFYYSTIKFVHLTTF